MKPTGELSGIARAAVVCLTALAVGTGVAGCGSTGTGSDAPEATGATTSPTASTPTSPSTPSSPASASSPATSTAAAQSLDKHDFVSSVLAAMQSQKSMHMSMTLGDSFREQADMSYAPTGLEMQATVRVAGQREVVRYVGGAMYLAIPGTTPPGKFIKVDSDNPMLGQLIGQLQALKPQDLVKTFGQGVKSVRDLGTTEIDGDAVRHYRVTVAATARQRALAQSLGAAAQAIPKSVVDDMYLTPDNLIRRSVVDVAGQKVVIDYSHWGEPVHIKAPPAAKVIPMPTGGASTH